MSLKITGSFQPNYAGVFNVLDNINFCNMSGLNADETYSVVEKEKIVLEKRKTSLLLFTLYNFIFVH